MWGSFAIAAIAAIVLLFVPGYLLLRAAKQPWWLSLACAPPIAAVCYSVLCTLYDAVGLFCTWVSVCVPPIVFAAAVFLISRVISKGSESRRDFTSAMTAAAYVTIGVAVTAVMYLYQIGSADAFIQSWDNVHHLDAVRGFVDSGCWSSFGTTLYLGQDAAINPFVEAPFYPSAWHGLAASIVSMLGVPVTLAINVTNFALIAIAFPLGTYALLRSVFGNDVRTVAAGALFMLANASCPWMMLTWGPLYPNIMACCLLPGIMASFVVMLGDGIMRGMRVVAGATVFVGALSYVFIQPSGVFMAIVLLAPYFVVRVYAMVRHSERALGHGDGHARMLGIGCAVIASAIVVLFWMAAFHAPFMQGVVQYQWPCDSGLPTALMDVLTQRFHVPGVAVGCSLLLAVGIVVSIVRRRQRWLIVSWLLACLIYVVCTSVEGYWHQLLAGFWYTDVPRIAAFAAFAAIPLQALGMGEMLRLAARPFEGRNRAGVVVAQAAMVLIVAALVYVPVHETTEHYERERHFTNASALGVEAYHIGSQYSDDDPRIYDNAERAFVQEALSIIPEGSLVINEPNDGSAYAYGVDGLRTYYRYWRGYNSPNETEKPESALIRARICNIATDDEVRAAVELVGAEYVLQLERGERSWQTSMWVYEDGRFWRGIDAVDNETEGFECILSRDDMRLYKIVL